MKLRIPSHSAVHKVAVKLGDFMCEISAAELAEDSAGSELDSAGELLPAGFALFSILGGASVSGIGGNIPTIC